MSYKIELLPKEKWQNYILPISYVSNEAYIVSIKENRQSFAVTMKRRPLDKPMIHLAKDNDYPDRLYTPFWPQASAWGIVIHGDLIAAVEICPETWSNRLRITEIWVEENYRRKGIGHALIAFVKETARQEKYRAVILETQSCNINAIDFYLHEGFRIIGFDDCCYSNDDIVKNEVRLEFGWKSRE